MHIRRDSSDRRYDVPAIAHKAASVVEWTYVPGEPKEKKFIKAILDTDKAGKEFLAKA